MFSGRLPAPSLPVATSAFIPFSFLPFQASQLKASSVLDFVFTLAGSSSVYKPHEDPLSSQLELQHLQEQQGLRKPRQGVWLHTCAG